MREAARRLLVREGAAVGLMLLFALFVEVVILRHTHPLEHIWAGMPGETVVCLVGAAMLEWVPAVRARPFAFGYVGYVVLGVMVGNLLGSQGGMDGPFFYVAYILPCVVIGLPASLPTRCAFTVSILAAFVTSFVAVRPETLVHPFAHVAIMHLGCITLAFIYFGDALHRMSRARFELEALARKQAQLLARDNDVLADEVRGQTRDLLAATDRAARVRWEERELLARALHDDLGQLLVSARVHLQNVEWALEAANERHQVGPLRSVLEGIESSARGIVTGFREGDAPFEVAVEDLVETYRSLERVDIALTLQCQEWEPAVQVRDACIRTVQEALNNVFKHADAQRAWVEIVRAGNRVHVRVRDDGQGSALESEGGMGILGMMERARTLGGQATVGPAPSGGTLVEVILPVLVDAQVAQQVAE